MDNKNENKQVNPDTTKINNNIETPKEIIPTNINSNEEQPKSALKENQVQQTNQIKNNEGEIPSNHDSKEEQIPTSAKIEENTTGAKKKGHPVFLILLLLFLFAFVFFLPDITKFITNYKNEKTGVNELKSGTMICSFNNNTDNIDYNYSLTFNYEKNRLKKSTMVTTNRLSDRAADNSVLTNKEESCQLLKTVLDENDIGMTADCSVSATVQVTTQNIDYEKLDLDFISNNIAEFEGFYPEYELNQSVTSIQNDLESNGYTCNRNEH